MGSSKAVHHQFASVHSEFACLLRALSQPGVLPDDAPDSAGPTIIQTHASAVLLTSSRAYKLKKPHDFGFFDYSTPERRRYYCAEEVRLNMRLAPQVYLGVAPILALPDAATAIGPTLAPGEVPEPGTPYGEGRVIDYVVVMRRLPEADTLEARVAAGTASPDLLGAVARRIAAFHSTAATSAHIAEFGDLAIIRANWEENFEQIRPYIGRTLDAATFERISAFARGFMRLRAPLFASRVRDGRIRDCHGDLRLQHVYASADARATEQAITIVDCIEFNERFRYGDGAGEVAFLAMELDAAGRPDLRRAFVDAYVAETHDETLRELHPFYACYRACVRGKVLSFLLDQPEVPDQQRVRARDQAAALFALAEQYASGPTEPIVAITAGVMGTGKSTLAARLRHELGWALVSSDATRKRLASVDPATPHATGFGQGLYTSAWTAQTYHAMVDEAETALVAGRSVILDATFSRGGDRQAVAQLAERHRARAIFFECVCPREVALERLSDRWSRRMAGTANGDPSCASDGRPELYDTQLGAWEAFTSTADPTLERVVISTAQPPAAMLERALDALGAPRLACWLAVAAPSEPAKA